MSFWSNFKGNSEIGPGLWPYSTLQKLNINWLLEAWKKLFNYDKSVESGKAWATTEEGAGFVDADFVPVNGVSGQYLGNTDGAPEWKSADSEPTKSSENLVTSGGVYDALDKKLDNPLGREIEDYYIGVSESGPAWVKPASSVDSDTAQNKLVQAEQVKKYVDKQAHIPDGGNNGQVLTKTEEGYNWENIPEQEKTSVNGKSGDLNLGIRNLLKVEIIPTNRTDYKNSSTVEEGKITVIESGYWNRYSLPLTSYLVKDLPENINRTYIYSIDIKTTNLNGSSATFGITTTSHQSRVPFNEDNNGKWIRYNIEITLEEGETLYTITFGNTNIPGSVHDDTGLIIEYRNMAIYNSNVPIDYVHSYETIRQVPTGGAISQVLTKTETGYGWKEIPASGGEVPSGGTQGQVLTKGTGETYSWQDVPEPEIKDLTVDNLKNKTNNTGVLVAEPGSESVPGNIVYDNPLSIEHGGTGRTDGYTIGLWNIKTYAGDDDLTPKELDGIYGVVSVYKLNGTTNNPITGDASSIVICHGNFETQLLFEDGRPPVRMFIRNSISYESWSDWEEVILTNTLNLVDLSKTRWAPAQTGGLLSFVAGSDQAPVLTKIDTIPTAGSSNPITSGAVKTALDSLPTSEPIANYGGKNGGCFVICDQNNVYFFMPFISSSIGFYYLTLKRNGTIKLEDKTAGLGNWTEFPIKSGSVSSISVTQANCLVNGVFSFSKTSLGISGSEYINSFGYFTGDYIIDTE